jgi:hypothetical protein
MSSFRVFRHPSSFRMQNFLICIEMFFAAWAHWVYFSANEFDASLVSAVDAEKETNGPQMKLEQAPYVQSTHAHLKFGGRNVKFSLRLFSTRLLNAAITAVVFYLILTDNPFPTPLLFLAHHCHCHCHCQRHRHRHRSRADKYRRERDADAADCGRGIHIAHADAQRRVSNCIDETINAKSGRAIKVPTLFCLLRLSMCLSSGNLHGPVLISLNC